MLSLCSRHPVRHLSFTSHSLITANVPYERVVRSADLDNFATHRRSVGSPLWSGCAEKTVMVDLRLEPPMSHYSLRDVPSGTGSWRCSRVSDISK